MSSNIILSNNYYFEIKVKFKTPPHPDTGICEVIIVEYTPTQDKEMSALVFETKEEYNEYVLGIQNIPQNGFCPTLAFSYNNGVICLKDDIGVQVFSPTSPFPVYPSKTATRASSWWTNEIQKILRVMYPKHDKGESLGFLYEHTYMNRATGTITFTKLRQAQFDTATEIYMDLLEVKRMMQDVENTIFTLRDTKPSELTLFYDLFPEQTPTSLELARTISYIVCHAPLFMGDLERYQFACNYHNIRDEDQKYFDEKVNFKGTRTDVGSWWLRIPKEKNNKYRMIYNNFERYDQKGLMPFIRRCYSHMSSYEMRVKHQVMDAELLVLFPDAFPKAYYAVFRNRLNGGFASAAVFVEKFRGGITPLDYAPKSWNAN